MFGYARALFLSPLLAIPVLAFTLPYLILAIVAYITYPWFALPEDFSVLVKEAMVAIPLEYIQTLGNDPNWDPLIILGGFVIGFLSMLYLYRIQRSAVKITGTPRNDSFSYLFFPTDVWLVIPGVFVIALMVAAKIYVMPELTAPVLTAETLANGATAGPSHLMQPFTATDPLEFYRTEAEYLRIGFLILLGLFGLFGLTSMRNVAMIDLPFSTIARGLLFLAVTVAAHSTLVVLFTIYAMKPGMDYVADAMQMQLPDQLWFYFAMQALLVYTIISVASAYVLKQKLQSYFDNMEKFNLN